MCQLSPGHAVHGTVLLDMLFRRTLALEAGQAESYEDCNRKYRELSPRVALYRTLNKE